MYSVSGLLILNAAAAYSSNLSVSTIGVYGLNDSVRNGKRWDTVAIATAIYFLREITI